MSARRYGRLRTFTGTCAHYCILYDYRIYANHVRDLFLVFVTILRFAKVGIPKTKSLQMSFAFSSRE